ncbi:hypothetical protein P691DRAFT_737243 [Macrolepiota fuliginosa MF-IS2]|uniref:3-oxo-5-alpha-steroid 4-dehydrogenase C-terminal domain-containing protein n=1 Tax=Macrolepiota fuliginosa MF-IS2 TaxID=1400762 RepID=A0A9P5X5B1_9AGAR|nr:hypothetical protein P691DRAFT_737243 [Macrolepiota fuliginosa MF-IS2]
MSHIFSHGPALQAYNLARKCLTLVSFGGAPFSFIINAPFGRFAPRNEGLFVLDGRRAWMVMEIVSPIMFIYALATAPLAQHSSGLPSITSPQGLLAALFLLHYANRAIISPLRTPSRSKHHIVVSLLGIFFNLLNGSIMGSYLSSPFTLRWFQQPHATQRIEFKLGLALWALGFIGNVMHDEILLNIRRKANAAGKARESPKGQAKEEYYAIPYGLLYNYISYPNYFCEWIEWFGFALASGPFPFRLSSLSLVDLAFLSSPVHWIFAIVTLVMEPSANFMPNLSPPWIFFLTEIVLMLPRAYKGHQWYKERFGESYPKERKAVIPFLL